MTLLGISFHILLVFFSNKLPKLLRILLIVLLLCWLLLVVVRPALIIILPLTGALTFFLMARVNSAIFSTLVILFP
jgi:hypothetical protein